MTWLRRFAYVSAVALLLGEPWRSIGSERFAFVWIDDVVVAALLLLSAMRLSQVAASQHASAYALFSGAWAATAIILFNSFFEKLYGLHSDAADAERLLAAFLGAGFVAVAIAFVLSLRLAVRPD